MVVSEKLGTYYERCAATIPTPITNYSTDIDNNKINFFFDNFAIAIGFLSCSNMIDVHIIPMQISFFLSHFVYISI